MSDVIHDMDDDTDDNTPIQHIDPTEHNEVEHEPIVAEDEWENAMEVAEDTNIPDEVNPT